MKEDIKLYLFTDYMITYVENLKASTIKPLELISNYRKTTGYKVSIQKSITFLYINNEQMEFEIKSTCHLHQHPKN